MRVIRTANDEIVERLAIAKGYDQAADHWVHEGDLSEATLWRNLATQERRKAKDMAQ